MRKPLRLKWFFYVTTTTIALSIRLFLMPTTSILSLILSHLESSLYQSFLPQFNVYLPRNIGNIFKG